MNSGPKIDMEALRKKEEKKMFKDFYAFQTVESKKEKAREGREMLGTDRVSPPPSKYLIGLPLAPVLCFVLADLRGGPNRDSLGG